MYFIQQNSTATPLKFLLVNTADHITGTTGVTPTVTISKNGSSFSSPSGSISEISNGWYKVAASSVDCNTLGPIALHASSSLSDPTDIIVAQVVSFNPSDSVRLGLTALPNANAQASGGLLTSGTSANQIDVDSSGRINVGKFLGTAVTADTAGIPNVNAKYINNISSSNVTTINANIGMTQPINFSGTGGTAYVKSDVEQINTQNTSASSTVSFPTSIASPTNITAGTITTVSGNVNGSVASVTGAVGSVTGNVGGNVVGSVASVTGAVGSVTGNVGGNVTGSVGSVVAAVAITSNRKKGSSSVITFTMTDSTTGADKTGLTVAGVISKDGGAFAGTSNSVTEIANGYYALTLTATEMTANNIALQFTSAGATNRDILIQTQP